MWILETVKIIVVLAQDYINRNFANLTSLKKTNKCWKDKPICKYGFSCLEKSKAVQIKTKLYYLLEVGDGDHKSKEHYLNAIYRWKVFKFF